MSLRRRIRKTIKWAGLALCALILAAWFWSFWWWQQSFVTFSTNVLYVSLGAGGVQLSLDNGPARGLTITFARSYPNLDGFYWWPSSFQSGGLSWYFIPAWIPLLLTAVPTSVAWRYDFLAARRRRIGHCKCGYDRRGFPTNAPCPECGSVSPGIKG